MKAITKTIGVIVGSATAIAIAFSAASIKGHDPFSTRMEANAYTLTLNSSNGIEGSNVTTTKTQATDSGQYQVDFNYTSCSSLAGGHARLLAGGKLVNKDHIRSIYNVTATFSTEGELKFRTSYDGATWGGYTSMVSTENYPLGSNPYYIEFSTDGNHYVDVSSIKFSYTCLENPDANGNEVTTNDVFQRVSYNTDLTSGDEIVIGAIYPSNSTWHSLQGELISGYTYYLKAANLTLSNSNTIADVTNANHIWTVLSGSSTGKWKLKYGNNYLKAAVSGTHYDIGLTTSYNATTCDWSFEFGSNSNVGMSCNSVNLGIKYYEKDSIYEFLGYQYASNSSYVKYIYKKVPGETHTEVDTPVDENGFTATDLNKDTYSTKSIFDSANGLQVRATFTDGTYQTLSKGGANGYSYVVKNSLGQVVDTSVAFPSAGQYKLYVYYKDYLPSVINLNVGEHYKTVTPKLATSSFNTSDIMSEHLVGNLTADIYNESDVKTTVNYVDFATYGLSVKLINPSNVETSMTSAFGTAGDWKIKVINDRDTTVFGQVTVTVAPILVTDITLSNSSISITKGESRTLSVSSVLPNDATNKGVTWSSDAESVATVNNSGVVTAVEVGTAHIRATANDGSQVYGECTVTVTQSLDYELVTDASNLSAGDKIVIANSAQGKTAGDISSQVMGSISSTFNAAKTKITSLGSGTQVLTLGGTSGSWTLKNSSNQLLGATAAKKLAWDSGTTTWSISISSGDATIQNGTNDYGRFLYNTGSPRFTTYTSATSDSMLLPQIYTLPSDPIYPTSIELNNANVSIGENVELIPVFTPADTNQKNVVWTSSKPNIATVSNAGVVTGVSAGTTTITATGKNAQNQDVVGSCTVTVSAVSVTGVTLQSTLDLGLNKSYTLQANISPANATNKNVTWTSSNTSVATVTSSGVVYGVSEGTSDITVKTSDGNFTAKCKVTVSSIALDDWTLLFYVCGADLESDSGAARDDLNEILSKRSSQPDSVNIVVETGGSTSWKMSGVSATNIDRFEINRTSSSMIRKQRLDNASMGNPDTLQSFLEWGFQNYPAQRYGLFMWNHGGAMDGCCFDDNYDGDGLHSNEVYQAVTNARNTCNITNKLDFIAYDACLMAVQDIAEMNSHNFKYMISSQETEWSGGYAYQDWLPTLYSNPSTVSTPDLLTSIGETFMDYFDNLGYHDQTQSVYDLSYMSAYKDAWENMTDQIKKIVNSKTKWTNFAADINKALKYGKSSASWAQTEEYNYGYLSDIFDVKGAINALKNDSTYSSLSTYFDNVLNRLNDVIVYNRYGSDSSVKGSCGMNLFCPICGNNLYQSGTYSGTYYEDCYGPTRTNFSKWQAFVQQYGNWA